MGNLRKVKHGGNGVRSDDVISSLKKCLQAIVLTMQVAIELNDKLFNRTFVIKNNRVPISLRKHEVWGSIMKCSLINSSFSKNVRILHFLNHQNGSKIITEVNAIKGWTNFPLTPSPVASNGKGLDCFVFSSITSLRGE